MLKNSNKTSLKKIKRTVKKIIKLKDKIVSLSDEELQSQTELFKERIRKGESLEKILPEAFAVVREASRRVLGMEHFPVQLMGGVALFYGKIAEMRTGEGKTLVSTCPAYLIALEEKGVNIVTVNSYLAKRDAQQMGKIHEFLGLSVGVVIEDMDNNQRKEAYGCDITYVTNNEIGFDYLRDNMAKTPEQQVLRGLHYCIIDEVDSVLIDEARTPLIISGKSDNSTSLYVACDFLARKLEQGEFIELTKKDVLLGEEIKETGDFAVNEKDKVVYLTEVGIKKVEEFFHIENLADPKNIDIQHNMTLALKAECLMHRDKDYVVNDEGEVLIVDEFTGRIMPGRRYSDGLHQAIEAKEKVDIKEETRTIATITFQNFFNKFLKKAGMTGTAYTERKEFRNIYDMDIVCIPTNRPVIRKDHDDLVYKTKAEKFNAVIEDIIKTHEKGQPVLVGTITIETSEMLSSRLKKIGISHNVLNAKYHEQEAEIISNAGKMGAVTIATNMAGRGTDIKLDDKAKELGGLKIIGTERHESRRIDNQLRGRSGRQGDPGESRFYLSLEDDLMRLFGSERMISFFNKIGVQDGDPIEHGSLTRTIEKAQKRIESNNYGIRENLLKYDEINNEQRELIYAERNLILNGDGVHNIIDEMIQEAVANVLNKTIANEENGQISIKNLMMELKSMFNIDQINIQEEKLSKSDLRNLIKHVVSQKYKDFQMQFENYEAVANIERQVLLNVIDQKWMDHIDNMEKLRESIRLQVYAQKDPLVEYKIYAYEMFDTMIEAVKEDVINTIFRLRVMRPLQGVSSN